MLFFSEQITPESELYKIHIPEQVTAGNESNFAPDLSTDGKIVIYTSDRKGNKDIWQKAAGGGFGYQLTKHSADDFSPVLSPDGDEVAFVSRREDAAGDITIMDIGFTFSLPGKNKEKPVESIASNTTEDSSPAWFPKGDKIVFASRKPGETSSVLMFAELSDRKAQPLSDIRGEQPSVSPDGKFVAYVRSGSIYVYDIDSDKNERLTESGIVQDGHPRFSSDGKTLVFVRYSDDTNKDGVFNADDSASVWTLDLAKHRSQKNKNNFEIEPLTSSAVPALYPQIRAPFLYVALSTVEGLDIFRYPQYGQVQLGPDKAKFEALYAKTADPDDEIFLLRKMQHLLFNSGDHSSLIIFAVREMEAHLERGKNLELSWLAEKLNLNYPEESNVAVISETLQIEAELAPLMFPAFQGNLAPARLRNLQTLYQRSIGLAGRLKADKLLFYRANAEILLIQAKLKASMREFFEASKILESISLAFPAEKRTIAKAHLYAGAIAPVVTGIDAAIVIYRDIIQNFGEQSDLVQLAVDRAVELVASSENPIEALQKLKTDSVSLPILASSAHLRIAEIFRTKNLESVYANELRQIVEQYPNAETITLRAADALSRLEEGNDRYDDAESMLKTLVDNTGGKSADFAKGAQRVYFDFLLRLAELNMKDRAFEAAVDIYARVIKQDPIEINAHRGLIDAHYRKGTLESIGAYYENQYDDNSSSAEWTYFWSYLLTYKIDTAKGVRDKIAAIDDAISVAEESRVINAQVLQIHQTLGWLYLQKGYWLGKYHDSGSVLAEMRSSFGITRSFFGSPEPNWLELGIESFQAAYYLSKPDSIERAGIARNLAQTYFELKNFQKALTYYSQRIKLLSIVPIREPEVEALLFRNAGRSAFQIEELELAENLQRNALLAWEKLDDKDMIKYSIDALALTLRERKNYNEAYLLYDRLRKLHASMKDRFNEIAAVTNMGYCAFELNRLDGSLALFDEAEKLLAEAESSGVKDTAAASGAIQIDLGGQGSSAKGFNVFDRKNLLLTFKGKIFEKWNRHDMVYDQYLAKLKLLKDERTFQIKENDKDDKFLAEEVSVAANNLGELAVRNGRMFLAAEHFKEAVAFAEFSRPEGQEGMSNQEALNYVNYLKIQLRKSSIGLLPPAELKILTQEIDARTAELQVRFDAGDKSVARFISQLVSVGNQMRLGTSGLAPKAQLTADNVKNMLAVSSTTDPAGKQSRSMMLAFKNLPDGLESDVSTPAKSAYEAFKDEALKIPSLAWKFHAMGNDFIKAYDVVKLYIAGGGVLASAADRLLLRVVFEKSFDQAGNLESEQGSLQLRGYLLTKYQELANRTFGATKVVEGKSVLELSPRIKALLDLKPTDDLKASLSGAGVVSMHRMINGNILVSYQSSKSSFFKIVTLKNSTKLNLENYQKVLADAGVLKSLADDGVGELYIVPSGELYNVQWDQVATDKGKLSSQYNIAYLPAVDFLPALYKRRNVNKHWISHVKSKLNPVEFKTSLGNRDYEGFTDEQPADLVALRKAEVLHFDTPLMLNTVEAIESYIDLNSDFVGQPKDVSLERYASANQTGSSGAIFSFVVSSNTELKSSVVGHDGWVSMFLASTSAGIPTILMVPAVEAPKKNEDNEVIGTEWKARVADWAKFYSALDSQNFAAAVRSSSVPGRIIGFTGVSAEAAKAIAEDELEGILEEAAESFEDQAFAEAAILLRKSYIYSYILDKTSSFEDLLNRIYESHHKNRRFVDAVYYIEKLIAFRSKAKEVDQDQLASDRLNAGISAVHGQMFEVADGFLKAAEDYFLPEEEWGYLARISEYRALNLSNQLKYQPSIDAYLKSYEYYLKSNPENAALKLLSVANIYSRYLSQYDKALEYFDRAAAELKKLGKPSYLSVIVDKANTLLTIGQIDAAISAIERDVLPALDEEEQISLWIRANQSLANIYFRGGKFPQARELTEKIIAQTQRIEDLKTRAERTNDAASLRAMVLAKTGNYTEAFDEFIKAIKLATKYDLKSQVALLYNNYGFWAREYGAIEQSIRFFEIAQRIDEELASKSSIAFDQRNLGLSSIVKGDYGRAEDLLSEALKTSEELNLAYNLAYSQFGLGDMEKTKGKHAEAAAYYEKALSISSKARLSDLVWRARAALGFMADLKGDKEDAEKYLRASIQTIESLSPGLKTEYSRNDFLSDAGIYEVYDRLIDLLMRENKFEAAWEYSERSRARGVIDTIASQNLKFASQELNDLMIKERDLKTDIDIAKQLGAANTAGLDAKNAEYKNVLANLSERNQKLLQFVSADSAPISFVKTSVKSGDALVQYHITAEMLHIWIISEGQLLGKSSEIKASALKLLVEDYREIMQNYSSTSFMEEKLSNLLIKPVADQLADVKRLVVVPHQTLHFFPFAALKLNSKYLIETMSVSYLESASQLRYAASANGSKNKSIVAFGYDSKGTIPFTLREVQSIKRFFPSTTSYFGPQATKAQLLASVKSADVLHIATHGEFNTSDPTQSYIELAGQTTDKLTVQEIFAIGNNLDLVILSACETGVGEISNGDEVISMHKAFSVAGAKNVVSNLWRINDVTSAVVMKRFYRALAEGREKDDALRIAQEVARTHFEHPAYWASFRLVGGYH